MPLLFLRLAKETHPMAWAQCKHWTTLGHADKDRMDRQAKAKGAGISREEKRNEYVARKQRQ